MNEKTLAVQRIASIVLAVLTVACTYTWYRYPGHPGNPHEWLNDTMKQAPKPWQAVVKVDDREQGKAQYDGLYLEMQNTQTNSVTEITPTNYTFMKIMTPDHRCFTIDICLKHGETRLAKCNP